MDESYHVHWWKRVCTLKRLEISHKSLGRYQRLALMKKTRSLLQKDHLLRMNQSEICSICNSSIALGLEFRDN